MSDIWFISDTHFFHSNMLKFLDAEGKRFRPFNYVEEMNELIVKNWNDRIRPQDHVWHLGDVTWRYDGPFNSLMSRLQGHKRMLLGNHDKLRAGGGSLLRWFQKIELWRGFKEHNFTCSHIPLRLDSLRDGAFNVHGHIHQNMLADPHYINVCVEHTNWGPVHLDEIIRIIKERG